MAPAAPIPDEGELRLGTVTLPAGRLLRTEDGEGEPVGWITEAAVPEPGPVWSALTALHGETGLVPILVPADRGRYLEVSCRDTAVAANVDRVDASVIFEHLWTGSFQWDDDWELAEDRAPFTSRFPGLAPAVDPMLAAEVLEAALRSFPTSRIAVVPADRPADVLPVLGWCPGDWEGAFAADTPVALAAVLRSWEDRFGARLLALTHDAAYLLIERPPPDLDAALPIAAEHRVFCDEPAGRQSVRTTAADIINRPVWYFWWD